MDTQQHGSMPHTLLPAKQFVAGKLAQAGHCQILNLLPSPAVSTVSAPQQRRDTRPGALGLHLAPAPTRLDLKWLYLYTGLVTVGCDHPKPPGDPDQV